MRNVFDIVKFLLGMYINLFTFYSLKTFGSVLEFELELLYLPPFSFCFSFL